MVFLYTSMVRSSYIIIVSSMGDDVPILGALVPLLEAMGCCCFWWCFYTSLWSDHHKSSLYWLFGRPVNIVIWSSGHLVIWSSGLLVFWLSGHLVNMVIWSSGHLVNMVIWSIWSFGHLVIVSSGHLVILSSGLLVIWSFPILWNPVLFLEHLNNLRA